MHAESLVQADEGCISDRYCVGVDAPLLLKDDGTYLRPEDHFIDIALFPGTNHQNCSDNRVLISSSNENAQGDDYIGKARLESYTAASLSPVEARSLEHCYVNPHHLINNGDRLVICLVLFIDHVKPIMIFLLNMILWYR